MELRVITFFSTKGGVGKSTLSLNTAVSLSLLEKKTLLLDLDLGAPLDMVKMCDAKPKKSIVDIIPVIGALKEGKLPVKDFLYPFNPCLDFLPAVFSPRKVPHITPSNLGEILSFLKTQGYEFIIIDGGRNLSDILMKIFDNSNLILLVVTPDILSVYQTEWILDTLQNLGFPLKMIKFLLNRAESKGGVSIQEIRAIFPSEIFYWIPSDGRSVGLALNKAVPLVIDNPKARISLSIKELAVTLSDKQDLYISHKELSNLRIEKVTEETSSLAEFWKKLGLVEPLEFQEEAREGKDEIVEIKKRVYKRLYEELDIKKKTKSLIGLTVHESQKLREDAERIVTNALSDEAGGFLSSFEVRRKLVKEIIDEALGLGPIEDFMKDPSITEIMVNNKDQVYIERNGKLELTTKKFTSNEQVKVIIERILAPLGRRIDESSPYVDARLPDGSRVNAIIPPLSLGGPTLTIRKFARQRWKMQDLVEKFKSLNFQMAQFLEAAVKVRKNILVSGGTGSGKTTFLNILSSFIPDNERIITIEDAAELKLHQEHWIRLESRPPNVEGKGAVTVRDLFRNTLRMRPDRIVVGEVRGREVLDMLQAMNTGHDGSMSTIHANSTHDVLIRLDSMILMAGIELPLRAIREMIASALDLIVHTARLSDGSRKVVQITEVAGMLDETNIALKDIFIFRQTGVREDGSVEGYFTGLGYLPSFYEELSAKGFELPRSFFQEASPS